MRPGTVFAIAGVLLAGVAALFAFDGLRAADGALGLLAFAASLVAGVTVALWVSTLLLLVTAPLWGKLPPTGRAAVSGAFAGYFAGLVVLVVRRARVRRV